MEESGSSSNSSLSNDTDVEAVNGGDGGLPIYPASNFSPPKRRKRARRQQQVSEQSDVLEVSSQELSSDVLSDEDNTARAGTPDRGTFLASLKIGVLVCDN
jgi:hypothetical protein